MEFTLWSSTMAMVTSYFVAMSNVHDGYALSHCIPNLRWGQHCERWD